MIDPFFMVPIEWDDDGVFDDLVAGKVARYLLRRMNNGQRTKIVYGRTLGRGSLLVGGRKASKDLGIPYSKFDRIIKRFEREGKVRRQPGRNGTVITVIAFSSYAPLKLSKEARPGAPIRARYDTRPGNKQERKKRKKEKELIPIGREMGKLLETLSLGNKTKTH